METARDFTQEMGKCQLHGVSLTVQECWGELASARVPPNIPISQ